MRQTLNEIYFGKTKDVVNDLRLVGGACEIIVMFTSPFLFHPHTHVHMHAFTHTHTHTHTHPRSVGDLKFAHKQRQLAAELKERMHAS